MTDLRFPNAPRCPSPIIFCDCGEPCSQYPDLPKPASVVTHAGMTAKQQTLAIVGAIFGAVAIYIGYDALTNPNLDGLNGYQRCSYWAYNHNHGGTVDQCQQNEAMAAAARMRGVDDGLTPAELGVHEQHFINVQPTDPNKKY